MHLYSCSPPFLTYTFINSSSHNLSSSFPLYLLFPPASANKWAELCSLIGSSSLLCAPRAKFAPRDSAHRITCAAKFNSLLPSKPQAYCSLSHIASFQNTLVQFLIVEHPYPDWAANLAEILLITLLAYFTLSVDVVARINWFNCESDLPFPSHTVASFFPYQGVFCD